MCANTDVRFSICWWKSQVVKSLFLLIGFIIAGEQQHFVLQWDLGGICMILGGSGRWMVDSIIGTIVSAADKTRSNTKIAKHR